MDNGKKAGGFEKIRELSFPRISPLELVSKLMCLAVSFVLGICRLPFGVYPLGIAFFCASSYNGIYAFSGLAAAAFFLPIESFVYLGAVLLALALRVTVGLFIDGNNEAEEGASLVKRLKAAVFFEALPLRAASGAVAAFFLSLYYIVKGGFRYYDLFGAILSVIAAAVGTVVFFGGMRQTEGMHEGNCENIRWRKIYFKLSRIIVSCLICLSLHALPLRGIDAGLAVGFMLVNRACFLWGLPYGLISAVLCGAACDISQIPVLLVVALAAYCVLDASSILAAAVSCIAGAVCGVVTLGGVYMSDAFLSLLFGCAVYATAVKLSCTYARGGVPSQGIEEYLLLGDRSRLEGLLTSVKKSLSGLPGEDVGAEMIELLRLECEEDEKEDKNLAAAISGRLFELGFGRLEVHVKGKRQLRVYISGENLNIKHERLQFLHRRLCGLCGVPLCFPKVIERGQKKVLYMYREYGISYSHAVACHKKEEVCGDTVRVFCDDRRGMLYVVICDGMGAGQEACSISSHAAGLLEPMLLGGLSPKRSLELLSKYDFGGTERSTTVDLLSLDLYTGEGRLYKSGAAPSYLLREDGVTKYSARTVPMGILELEDSREIKLRLSPFDVFVMASDGISEDGDSLLMMEYLNSHKKESPAELARDLISICEKAGGEDDMSAAVIKIFKWGE